MSVHKLKIQNATPKIRSWLPRLALLLVLAGQVYYLPARLGFVRQLLEYARLPDATAEARVAYGAASYDLLAWVEAETPPDTTLLLLTASPRTYGDPAYVLYHRAVYHLYPRRVWWAAPVETTPYPAWWSFTDLDPAGILALAGSYGATAVLADGFARPPVPGAVRSFDPDT
ncbi:MAG: hypothetical protein ACE5H9_17985, partial [Anaerolineae bacterium]